MGGRTQIQTQAIFASKFIFFLVYQTTEGKCNHAAKQHPSVKRNFSLTSLGVYLCHCTCVFITINNSSKGEECQLSSNTKISFI